MIGTIVGVIVSFIWGYFLKKIQIPSKSTPAFQVVSKSELKKNYHDFITKARVFFFYSFIYGFTQFLVFALWLFYILEIIRPNISEGFETNLVGFLFFQSMLINLSFGTGIYGYFFEIFAIPKRVLNSQELKRIGLDTGFSHFYIIGEDVKKVSQYLIYIFVIYYLIVHNLLLIIWG